PLERAMRQCDHSADAPLGGDPIREMDCKSVLWVWRFKPGQSAAGSSRISFAGTNYGRRSFDYATTVSSRIPGHEIMVGSKSKSKKTARTVTGRSSAARRSGKYSKNKHSVDDRGNESPKLRGTWQGR